MDQSGPITDVPSRDFAGLIVACGALRSTRLPIGEPLLRRFPLHARDENPAGAGCGGHIPSNQAWLGRTIWFMVATNSSQALRWLSEICDPRASGGSNGAAARWLFRASGRASSSVRTSSSALPLLKSRLKIG